MLLKMNSKLFQNLTALTLIKFFSARYIMLSRSSLAAAGLTAAAVTFLVHY